MRFNTEEQISLTWLRAEGPGIWMRHGRSCNIDNNNGAVGDTTQGRPAGHPDFMMIIQT